MAAVSGGSDSSALLLLLREHLAEHAPRLRLLAVTVDHGMREGSAAEAAGVAAFAIRLGVAHRILQWEGPKPQTGLPAAARHARYHLLKQAAEEAGARIVVTGHTADDQAETVAMRLARGEGRGLAGMAPATLYDGGLWIARPLLGAPRADLRKFLQTRDFGWVDDPTNEDTRFERARLRGSLAISPRSQENSENTAPPPPPSAVPLPRFAGEEPRPPRGKPVDPPLRSGGGGPPKAVEGALGNAFQSPAARKHLLRLAQATSLARCEMVNEAAELIRSGAEQPVRGLIRLQYAVLIAASRPTAIETLRLLLATVGGREFPVDALRTGALLDRLDQPGRQTLGGVVVERRSDAVFLIRENRGIAHAEARSTFDNRFRLSTASLPGRVEAWGEAIRAEQLPLAAGLPRSLIRAAMVSAPAFRLGDGRLIPLEQAGIVATPLVTPFSRFLPGFDLPLAQALARLVGAPPFPPSPYRGHFGRVG